MDTNNDELIQLDLMNNSALILSQGTLPIMTGINDAKKQLNYADSSKQNVNNSYSNLGNATKE